MSFKEPSLPRSEGGPRATLVGNSLAPQINVDGMQGGTSVPNAPGTGIAAIEKGGTLYVKASDALCVSGLAQSTNPKDKYGDLKPDVSLIPPVAILEEAKVMKLGATKYGAYNWREKAVRVRVYTAAAMRHILAWQDGEDLDSESGASHLAHARACLGILLDARNVGNAVDDRAIVVNKSNE